MIRASLLAAVVAIAALPAEAAAEEYLVTNSFDVGAGSLRQAITDANNHANTSGPDTIAFADLGSSPKITPDTELPPITEAVVIDGYTHPGASANTRTVGNDAVLKVELSGEDFSGGTPRGLTINGTGSTIRGLAINRFDGPAIQIAGGGDNAIRGNFIGTDVTGSTDLTAIPNTASDGVLVLSSVDNTIGGASAAARNVISGNGDDGIEVFGAVAGGNLIRGNYIGTAKSGRAPLGNDDSGVAVDSGAVNTVVGGSTALARNVISSNDDEGVSINGDATARTLVQGNYIGTDATGTRDLGNAGIGVDSFKADDGVVGGTAPGEGNVISGNQGTGVNIRADDTADATGNRVQGNRIGTNAAGNAAIGNGFDGIQVHSHAEDTTVGGLVPRARNVVSGNQGQSGIFVSENDTRVQGNYIGTDASGTSAIPNADRGIIVFAVGVEVGGTTAAARNVISGNAGNGVEIFSFTQLQGNYIGVDATGTEALPNENGVAASHQAWIGTATAKPGAAGGNVISGNRAAGVLISGEMTGNVEVFGNLIGTDADGAAAVPNGDGIVIEDGASTAAIGFTARNVISGNDFAGVLVRDPGFGHNVLFENYIGLNRAGTAAIPNGIGVEFAAGASDNALGSPQFAKRNVIAGNRFDGVRIHGDGTSSNEITRAWIGLKPDGTRLANQTGVRISSGAEGNTVGSATAGLHNTISGNTTDGVLITGAETSRNVVRGNRIGTTPGGSAPLPNAVGVNLTDGARFNTVGGPLGQPLSLISGNTSAGVRVSGEETTGNRIQGNSIGTAANGETPLGNRLGVLVTGGAQATTIGGTGALGNRIAFNDRSGIVVDGAATAGAELVRNLIFQNGRLAIDLRRAGEPADTVTPNDADDPDSGPNALQNFPVISAATGASGATTITGTLNSTPGRSYRIEVFRNPPDGTDPEARVFAGATSVTTNANGNATWSLTLPADFSGHVLRATATRVDIGNTSELSAARTVG